MQERSELSAEERKRRIKQRKAKEFARKKRQRQKKLLGLEELEIIYENRESYPIKLLAALCNNPEMQEYIKDYPVYQSGDISVAGKAELTKEEKEQKYPLFLQWDKRWGYEEYGNLKP